MQKRVTIGCVLAAASMAAAALAGGSATADDRAEGLEEIALLNIPQVTHFDFFQREVRGENRVFAMVGSRSFAPQTPVQPSNVYPTPGGGLNLVDVTDPADPRFLANVYCPTDNNDVAYVEAEHVIDGVLYDAFVLIASNDPASDGCGALAFPWRGGVNVIGIRAEPLPGETLSVAWLKSPFINPDGTRFAWTGRNPAAHTVVSHPTRPVVYVGNQNLADRSPSVEILDLSVWPPIGYSHEIGIKVDATRTVPTAPAVGPHDITFSPAGDRAYVSAVDASFIWDVSGDKLFAPELISTLVSPNLKIHHETVLHPNGRHLLTVDEFVATSNENIPMCPGGALHIFDTGPLQEDGTRAFERAPVPVGQFYADEIGTLVPFGVSTDPVGVSLEISCTAHEFAVPAAGDWMPLAWFGAGVRLLDLSQLEDPDILASPIPRPIVIQETGYLMAEGNDVWAAKPHPLSPDHIFATDTALGFKVLKRI